jgi:MYXO-CTERM domain-containing protein
MTGPDALTDLLILLAILALVGLWVWRTRW